MTDEDGNSITNHNDFTLNNCKCVMCDANGIVFLIGGHDLEMQTITEILIDSNQNFIDRNLRWDNARLSAYSDFFDFDGEIYGVELYEDVSPPLNYTRIDHHNDYIGKKSSLEQVADVIGVGLNRRQRLVSANDSRYIPGMLAIGASQTEIQEIRRADRKAQGVTETDERLADEAIKNNLTIRNGITVVRSETHRFSTICDKLYPYGRLLIYTDSELVYYGERANDVAVCFDYEIKCGKAFKGGSDAGFFGLANGHFSKDEILNCLEKIISILK